MLAAMFILAGCATTNKNFALSDVTITPVDGPVAPKYVPASGSLEIEEAFAINDREYPRGTIKVDYSVVENGEGLQWAVTFIARKLPLLASVKSDKLGNINSLDLSTHGVLLPKTSPKAKIAVIYIMKLFNSVFMPLVDADAAKGNAISEKAPLSVSQDISLDKNAKAVVSGMATYNGIQCYVVKYHAEGSLTVPSTREVIHNVRDVFLLVNKDTLMPVVGEARNVAQMNGDRVRTVTNISRLKAVY